MVDEVEGIFDVPKKGVCIHKYEDGYLLFVDASPLHRYHADKSVAEADMLIISKALKDRESNAVFGM